jgi:hypothetical protein
MGRIWFTRLEGFLAVILIFAALYCCGGGGGGGTLAAESEAGDSEPPAIVSSEPSSGDEDVSVNTTCVRVDFSEDVAFEPSMLTIQGEKDNSDDSALIEGRTLYVFFTDRPLATGTTYALTFTGIRDGSGNVMPEKTISFPTGEADTDPPFIVGSSPADGAQGVKLFTIEVQFNEKVVIDSSMVEVSPEIDGLTGDRFECSDGWFYKDFLHIDLSGLTLEPGQEYEVRLTGVKDLSGNTMPSTAFSFTTLD